MDAKIKASLKDIIREIKSQAEPLRRLGVQHLYIFGSRCRGSAHEHSDLDLLIAFNERAGYFDLARVQSLLQPRLGLNIDPQFVDSVPKQDPVWNEAIRVF